MWRKQIEFAYYKSVKLSMYRGCLEGVLIFERISLMLCQPIGIEFTSKLEMAKVPYFGKTVGSMMHHSK